MLKKILAASLLGLAALSFAVTAFGAPAYSYRSAGMLKFRHYQAVASPSFGWTATPSVGATAGYYDSTGCYNLNTSATYDTSVVFRLPKDFVIPTASDSLPPVMLIFRSTAAFASGDTVYAIVEPAFTGDPGSAASTGLLSGSANDAITAFAGATQTGVLKLFPALNSTTAGSQTATASYPVCTAKIPTFGLSQEFRVRLFADKSGSTANGFITCEVWYTSNNAAGTGL